MMVCHVGDFVILIGSPHLVFSCARNTGKIFILQSCLSDKGHIMGGGIMVFIRKTMGIGKMSIRASQICGFLVHHFHKGVDGTGHMLCQTVSALIGGFQQQGVQGFLYRQLFPFGGSDAAAAGLNGVSSIIGICDYLVQRAIIKSNESRHNLGDAGRVIDHIHILII